MAETVSFKASKANLAGEVEVRRFQVDKDVSSSFTYLHQKLASVFPDIARQTFVITWIDGDTDMVTISTDEDLIIALTEMEGPLYKISIVVRGDAAARQDEGRNKGELHAGVTCDGCQGPVHGFRYKCITCPDFDLCSSCEATGVHAEHNMIRMVKPMPTAWPHHFFKKFQRMQERAERSQQHNSEEDEGVHPPPHHPPHHPPRGSPPHRRPIGRYGCLRGRGGGPLRGRGAGGVGSSCEGPNPFERMMSGWGRGWSMDCEDPGFGSSETAAGDNTTEENAKKRKEAEENMRKQTADCLNNIGQFVSAVLDPFGINVGVSVVTKDAKSDDKPQQDSEATKNADPSAQAKSGDTKEAEKEKPMDTDESKDDSEWTVIKDGEQAKNSPAQQKLYPNIGDDHPTTEASAQKEPTPGPSKATPTTTSQPSAPQDQEMLDPKIQVAIEAMLNMGFTNEGGWLTTLLEAKQGDISKVLDMLQPVRK